MKSLTRHLSTIERYLSAIDFIIKSNGKLRPSDHQFLTEAKHKLNSKRDLSAEEAKKVQELLSKVRCSDDPELYHGDDEFSAY